MHDLSGFLQAQFAKDIRLSAEDGAKLYLFIGLGTTISRPTSGILCQLKTVKALVVLQVSVLLLGIVYLLLTVLTTYQLLVMFSVLFGLLDGLFMTSMNIVALSIFKCPQKASSAFGMFIMCLSVPFAVGPPIAGISF